MHLLLQSRFNAFCGSIDLGNCHVAVAFLKHILAKHLTSMQYIETKLMEHDGIEINIVLTVQFFWAMNWG